MRFAATEARNRFGSLCTQAKREPVFVKKVGRLDLFILSAEHFQALPGRAGPALRRVRMPLKPSSAAGSLRRTLGSKHTAFRVLTCALGKGSMAHYTVPLPAKTLGRSVDNVAAQASALVWWPR